MKKTLWFITAFISLGLLCYFLLFLSLDITALIMESDDDINKAGKITLAVLPFIFFTGLFVAKRVFTIRMTEAKANRIDRCLTAFYGGLFGMAALNLPIKLFILNTDQSIVFIILLVLSFLTSTALTAVLTKTIG